MSLAADLFYAVRWLIYALSSLLHALYQCFVFLSKPGAALIVAYSAYATVLYLHVDHRGLPVIDPNGDVAVIYDAIVVWLTFDAAGRGLWPYLEIALLALALTMHLFPKDVLRSALGLFPAKARPLPPMRPVRVPKLKIKAARVRRAVKPLRKRFLRWPYRMKRQLPKDVAALLVKAK